MQFSTLVGDFMIVDTVSHSCEVTHCCLDNLSEFSDPRHGRF